MGAPSKIIEDAAGSLLFVCPGCGYRHRIPVGKMHIPRWNWNGDLGRPTVRPNVMVTYQENHDEPKWYKWWRKKRRCNFFVTDGRIQFLVDSTHALAGQTVDLPDIQSQ